MLLQVVTVPSEDGNPGLKRGNSSPSLRFRGAASSAMFKPVRSANYSSVDKSTYQAATTAAIGCSLLLASLIIMLLTGSVSFPGSPFSDTTRRHEIHLKPTLHSSFYQSIDPVEFAQSPGGVAKTAILYTVFGEWNAEVEWEFVRLVNHVTRSPYLTNFDIVLLWETADRASVPVSSPANSAGMSALLATHPDRVSEFEAVASDAASTFPPTAFQHGFYYNPEVAAIMFLTARPQYDYVWLLESDARWTVRRLSCTQRAAACHASAVGSLYSLVL